MRNFLKIIENDIWYWQFIYGAVLALFFVSVTAFCGNNVFWAFAQIALIAGVREHFNEHMTGDFNWRNFFFLLVPVILVSFFL